MRRGCVLAWVLALGTVAGCGRSDRPPNAPHARERADTAQAEVPAASVCTRACDRLGSCGAELGAAYSTDPSVIAGRFPFACDDECARLEGVARGEVAHVDDCVPLDSCIAFYTCTTGDPPPMELTPVAARRLAPNCASLCAREQDCRTRPDETGKDAEAACVLRCEAAPDAQSPLPCASRRTCGGLVGCVDGWRDSGYASELDAAPPGVSPTCDALCTRAIRCGAEATGEELADEELAELRDTMSSTYMECALQCGEELDEKNRPRFDKCIAQAECEAFEECADAL